MVMRPSGITLSSIVVCSDNDVILLNDIVSVTDAVSNIGKILLLSKLPEVIMLSDIGMKILFVIESSEVIPSEILMIILVERVSSVIILSDNFDEASFESKSVIVSDSALVPSVSRMKTRFDIASSMVILSVGNLLKVA